MLMPYNRLRLVSAVVLFLSVLSIEWFHYSRSRPHPAVASVVPQTGKRGGTVCYKNMRAASGTSQLSRTAGVHGAGSVLPFIGTSHDGVGHGVDRRRRRNRGSGRLAGSTGTVPYVAVVAEDEAVLGTEQAADALIDGYPTFGGPSCPSRVVCDEANCGDTRRRGHLGCGATSAGHRAGGVGAESDEVVAAEAGAYATDKFIEEHYGDSRRT